MSKKIVFFILAIIFFTILVVGIIYLNKEKVFISENYNDENSGVEELVKVENIKIKVNDEVLIMKLEQNSATRELVEKLEKGNISINAHEYGNFEQVGSLGFSLPKSDTQIKTKSGDVMLYEGNQITFFYGSNSWNYTKLGEIINKSESELKDILGSKDVTLILSIN